MKTFYLFCLTLFVIKHAAISQNIKSEYVDYLEKTAKQHADFEEDYYDHIITNTHTSSKSKVRHYYINQRYFGIEIKNAVMGIHIDSSGKLAVLNDQFITGPAFKVNAKSPVLSPVEAIKRAAQHLHYTYSDNPSLISKTEKPDMAHVYSDSELSQENIPVKLMYQPISDGSLHLVWDLSIQEIKGSDWWSIRIDALTGDILDKENLTKYCDFGNQNHRMHHENCLLHNTSLHHTATDGNTPNNFFIPNSYNVFPLGTESPNHGPRQIKVSPFDNIASPYGWHDTNGIEGPEYTTTKGNNVEAKDDIAGDNETTIGAFANGGVNLEFDFPLNFSLAPASNLSSAITNLFYWNNVMHDVWYQYGFTEAAGNFQQNNYGRGGVANDFVYADGLDGSSSNNANFSTPVDGTKPRMQMFLWTGTSSSLTFTVNTPGNIAGNYTGAKASFGAQVYNFSADLVLADPILACSALTNAGALNGKIAVIDRGTCEFGAKCLNAQNAGAIAVMVCNNVSGNPIAMSPGANGASVTIPCIMLSQANCNTIKLYIPGVNVTLIGTGVQIDGDFDNGVIAHEYGHGISTRLTGGAGNSSCLNNDEQMGEGWSDWFGLMLTINAGDQGTTGRGIGTYVTAQPTSGTGIRTYKYSTDMIINPHTYASITSAAIPHGIGSVWCAMLWEMTWLLTDAHGFDPDYYYGTGGNNIAMALVTEALKLQPCSPGFVDGRNAILAADDLLYGGIHRCLIWKAFAKRGLGFSANQGSSGSRSDGTQVFDMPSNCCKQVYVTDNAGIGSLRGAISCAANGDTIKFAPFLDGKIITLSGGITIDKNVFVKCETPNQITLKTNDNAATVVIANNNVELENMKLTGGSNNTGRVLINNGNLKCTNITFIDALIPEGMGNSIQNNGTLIFSGNNKLKNE